MSRPHYLVFVEGQNVPKRTHGTVEKAKAEAERLADKTGKRAWLLLSLGTAFPRPRTPAGSVSGVSPDSGEATNDR